VKVGTRVKVDAKDGSARAYYGRKGSVEGFKFGLVLVRLDVGVVLGLRDHQLAKLYQTT